MPNTDKKNYATDTKRCYASSFIYNKLKTLKWKKENSNQYY
jgi:hypothetical protein